MTRVIRVLVMLAAIAGVSLVVASPASAAFGIDCKEAPVAAMPDSGISGLFVSAPDPLPADGPNGDKAWANGAPVFANYGAAGMTFHTYDLGCGPDATRDPGALMSTTIANWFMLAPKAIVAATGALMRAAYNPTYLATFNPLLAEGTADLRAAIFDNWVPLAFAVVGLMIITGARKSNLAKATLQAVWAIAVIVGALAIMQWPVQAGSAVDGAVGETLGEINNRFNGTADTDPVDAAVGGMANAALWQEWKVGTFGRTDVPEKWARGIFTATANTWEESAIIRSDPNGKGRDIVETKAALFDDIASEIQDEAPDVYRHLQGKEGDTRIGAAAFAIAAALLTAPFLIAASLVLIGSYLVMRFAVMFVPVLAPAGAIYSLRGIVRGVALVVAAAVVNSLILGIGAAINANILNLLLSPDAALPEWLSLTLAGVTAFMLWVAMKPARRLTKMAAPEKMFAGAAGAVGDASARTKSAALGFGKAAAAAYTGNVAALAVHDRNDDDHDDTPAEGQETAPPEADTTTQPAAPRAQIEAAPVRDETTTDTTEPAPTVVTEPTRPESPDGDGVFVPGDPGYDDTTLPNVAEPTVASDGDEVYFIPFDTDARTT